MGRRPEWTKHKEVKLLKRLTHYPESIIINILNAQRLMLLDNISDKAIEDDDKLPEVIEFSLAFFGKFRVERLYEGRSSDELQWYFTPTEEFNKLFVKAFYEGKSPMLKIMKKNFKEYAKFRSDNIIKVVDDEEDYE
jgi:hypothetical protein